MKLPSPSVRSFFFTGERDAFTYPMESYDSWVLLGVKSGSFRFSFGSDSGEGEALCGPGEFVICPPGVVLRRQALEKIVFYFIQFRWKPREPSFWQGKHSLPDHARLESTLSHLARTPVYPSGEDKPWVDHLLLDLLMQSFHESRRVKATPPTPTDRQMLRAAGMLESSLGEPVPLGQLASEMRMSVFQFSRRFKAALGLSPSAYRTKLRMSAARRLLLETDRSLEEIAGACGYENAFYFSRVFHAENGMPPSRFRRDLRV